MFGANNVNHLTLVKYDNVFFPIRFGVAQVNFPALTVLFALADRVLKKVAYMPAIAFI